MDVQRAKELLTVLADGVDPLTGEVLPDDHVCNKGEIVLDPILIFGWFGLPRLEVRGAAIATVAGQIIAAIIGLFVNLKKNPEIHIRAKLVRWHGATAGEIYRVGVPSIIMGSIAATPSSCSRVFTASSSRTRAAAYITACNPA